jgi:hypothetical protein
MDIHNGELWHNPPQSMAGKRTVSLRRGGLLRHVNRRSSLEVDFVQHAILEMQQVAGNEKAPLVVSFFDFGDDCDRG